MKISVIIPTYHRNKELENAIRSVLNQSILPNEIIVVDNGNSNETKNLILSFSEKELNVTVKYLESPLNSASVARNIGMGNANGDIILFLDDDDKFDIHYIEEIMKVYCKYPNALLVQGNIERKSSKSKWGKLWNIVWNEYSKFFCSYHFVTNEKKILPSGKNISPLRCDKIINCQWASGGCSSIKKEVSNEFLFDENLIKYSYCEDMDFSYRLYKQNPTSIYLAPKAKLLYQGSFNKSAPVKKAVLMEKTYNLYFVSKNLGRPINYILFFWSELGIFLGDSILLLLFMHKDRKARLLRLLYSLYAYIICIRFFNKIKNLDIEFINNRYLL